VSYSPPPCAFTAAYHWPHAYRYLVAEPGLRLMRNRYTGRDGSATIGLALTAGRYAYCIKWADARTTLRQTED
jgi:hypothetical protein